MTNFTVDNYKSIIGKRISNIRKDLGLSMEEFGKKMDPIASKGAVSNWENGYNLPNNSRLKVIADLGNISVQNLISIDDFKPEYSALMLKKIRKEKNISQKELSDLTGISLKKISEQENGIAPILKNDIPFYSKAFKLTDEDFISKLSDSTSYDSIFTTTKTIFGSLVKEKRVEKKLGINDLATIIKTSKNKIIKIENGEYDDIPISIMNEICKTLNISPRHLIYILDKFESYEEYISRAEMQKELISIIDGLNYMDTKKALELANKKFKK